jgi:hypothetical protein
VGWTTRRSVLSGESPLRRSIALFKRWLGFRNVRDFTCPIPWRIGDEGAAESAGVIRSVVPIYRYFADRFDEIRN